MSSQEINQLNEQMDRLQTPMDIYEAHGCLCGLLSASSDVDKHDWFAHVLDGLDPNNLSVQEVSDQLAQLFDQTIKGLDDAMLGFQLLLPDEDEALEDRTLALADWCQGFLFGLGAGGFKEQEALSEDVQEILKDISEISRIAHAGEDDDENEEAFMELVEYIRVGVLLVYGELGSLPDGDGPTLH